MRRRKKHEVKLQPTQYGRMNFIAKTATTDVGCKFSQSSIRNPGSFFFSIFSNFFQKKFFFYKEWIIWSIYLIFESRKKTKRKSADFEFDKQVQPKSSTAGAQQGRWLDASHIEKGQTSFGKYQTLKKLYRGPYKQPPL